MASIAVIGTGYVGITTAACLASLGQDVHATDIDAERIAQLNEGVVPILEPGLDELLAGGLATRRLRFSSDNRAAARTAEFVFLCPPTPPRPDGTVDTSAIDNVVTEVLPVLRAGSVVVTKSTCPLGFNARLGELMRPRKVAVVSNPEFLREGHAVADFFAPDRIVIGSDDPEAAQRVSLLLGTLSAPRFVMSPTEAEMVKYGANAFLAVKITFANTLADLSEAFGTDVRVVAQAIGADHRIGSEFLQPGPGYGGSCLSKDTRALSSFGHSKGSPVRLIETVIAENEQRLDSFVHRVADSAGGSCTGKTVALWGLTFKAGTSDLRASPAVALARRLIGAGATVRGYDPAVIHADITDKSGQGVDVLPDRYSACQGADVLVVATEWPEFRDSDWEKVAEMMNEKTVVDARNVLDPDVLTDHGFRYVGVGIPRVTKP
jgi:UDPglucose 6-dehydrogenase